MEVGDNESVAKVIDGDESVGDDDSICALVGGGSTTRSRARTEHHAEKRESDSE